MLQRVKRSAHGAGDTGIKNHTVVMEALPRTTTTHSGVESLSDHAVTESQGPDRSLHGQCNTLL